MTNGYTFMDHGIMGLKHTKREVIQGGLFFLESWTRKFSNGAIGKWQQAYISLNTARFQPRQRLLSA